MLEPVANILLELHRGCRRQATESFAHGAMDLVRQVIPHDDWFWGSGSEIDGQIVVHAASFGNIAPESMQIWERYKHLDVFAARAAAERNVVLMYSNEMMKATEIYHLLYRKVGIEQLMGIYTANASSGLYEAISLYRSCPTKPFSEAERQVMQCLVPHLIEARHVNYLEHLSTGRPEPRHRCVAAVDGKGIIHVACECFAETIQKEWVQWRGPRLPHALTEKQGDPAQRYIGKAITAFFVPVFDMFLLNVRPREPVDDLSARELQIARRFSGGLSNKEVAQLLGLAPATVRNHLSSIYLKLGVSDKAALATLLAGADA